MSLQKRPRSTFEADLQKQESPYVFYGTPLPPLDPEVRDDGSFVPVWKQEARDERGRKRFHGAFTGGYSAGYFNTVGSKEGWTPSTFVSSRAQKADGAKSAQQRAEDFMDEEDLADAAEAKQIQTASTFTGLGGTAEDSVRRDAFMDLMRPSGETIGARLLSKMGWRQGQGLGPRVKRKARLDDVQDHVEKEVHLFAPENSKMISFARKNDFKGLGYRGELPLANAPSLAIGKDTDDDDDRDDDSGMLSRSRAKVAKKPPEKKGGFGIGVLNDTGSDDDDPYEMGPKISYNRSIGGDKKIKRGGIKISAAKPSLPNKPVFRSSRNLASKANPRAFLKCHDGRLPLDGFALSTKPSQISMSSYPPPKIPEGWKSSKQTASTSASTTWQSSADAAKSSTLDPKQRATLLGEESLPGKSVFDFLTPEARARLAAVSGRIDLPAAGGETLPQAEEAKARSLWSQIPILDKDIATAALARANSGWMPYSDDEGKRRRYRAFLELKAGIRDNLPERVTGTNTEDWIKELHEFAQAALVFKPVSGMMASRFTTSSRTFEGGSNDDSNTSTPLLSKPVPKAEDSAEAAAKLGMFGPMTRSRMPFYPTRLLCKRFNVKPPENVGVDPGPGSNSHGTSSARVSEVVDKRTLERMMQDAAIQRSSSNQPSGAAEAITPMPTAIMPVVLDPERNDALEGERAGDDLFKAIFGSDEEE